MPFRHREIADALRQQITTGRLGPGERLSSEPALAAQYSVSTGTLRRALSVLQGEGLIDKFHGRGNFVRRPLRRFMYVGGWGTFAPWTAADASLCVTVRAATVPAQGLLVDLLDVPTGSPLTEFVCVSHEGATPLGLARIYLPHDPAPVGLLGEAPSYEQTAKRFAVLSSSPTEVRETVCARPPTPDEVSALRDQSHRGRPRDHTYRHGLCWTSRGSRASGLPRRPYRRGLHHRPCSWREATVMMTEQNELRLLPWLSPEGKPCYLSTDDSGSFMSRLADAVEADQLFLAANLLKRAVRDLADDDACPEHMRKLVEELTGALCDALRAAVRRGFPSADSASHSV